MATRSTEEALVWAETANLSDWAGLFWHRYNRRNLWANASIRKRVILLQVAVRQVQEAVRQDRPISEVQLHSAHVFAWLMSIVNYVGNKFYHRDLSVFMAMKYPGDSCTYCGSEPCVCLIGVRPPFQIRSEWTPEQTGRSLGAYQAQLEAIYGPRNKKEGIDWVIGRLHSEVTEIGELLARCDINPMGVGAFEQKLAFEICDVLAWICAVAYSLGFSLEEGLATVYATKCPFCGGDVCQCDQATLERGSFIAQTS